MWDRGDIVEAIRCDAVGAARVRESRNLAVDQKPFLPVNRMCVVVVSPSGHRDSDRGCRGEVLSTATPVACLAVSLGVLL